MEPLFIRWANKQATVKDIIDTVLRSTDHEPSKEIARQALEKDHELEVFRRDFKEVLKDLSENGINRVFINYVDSYMKPSLTEIVEGSSGRTGEIRRAALKSAEAPWIEAVVCYNLSLYIRAYGATSIKECPKCHKFFCHKGKYGKYCSEACKG